MKRRNKLILMGIIIVLIMTILFSNKSFLRGSIKLANKTYLRLPMFLYFDNSYGDHIITFKTWRKEKTLNKYFDNYLDGLDTCYEGRVYYDQVKDISIKRIDINHEKHHKNILIEYKTGNICETEYMLDKSYYDTLELANFNKIILNKYTIKKGQYKTSNKEITYDELKVIIKDLTKFKEVTTNKDIPFNITNNMYTIEAYYYLDNKYYALYIFNTDTEIIVRVIDEDNHPKHIVYNPINSNLFIKNIYD